MPSEAYIQILGTDTGDMSPGCFLFTDAKRHLFNVCEGTQRFCMEHGVKTSRIANIFVTRISTETLGGLPGMLLTLGDQGVNEITIHGPPQLTRYVLAMRHFMNTCRIQVNVMHLLPNTPCAQVEDDGMTILPVYIQATTTRNHVTNAPPLPLYPHPITTAQHTSGNNDATATGVTCVPKLGSAITYALDHVTKCVTYDCLEVKQGSNRTPSNSDDDTQCSPRQEGSPKRMRVSPRITKVLRITQRLYDESVCDQAMHALSLPATPPHPPQEGTECLLGEVRDGSSGVGGSVVYVCHMPTTRGRFDPSRARQLGVMPGRQYGELSRGVSLTLSDGTVVRPSDVMSPSTPGSIFMIVDCESVEMIHSLVTHPRFHPYHTTTTAATTTATATATSTTAATTTATTTTATTTTTTTAATTATTTESTQPESNTKPPQHSVQYIVHMGPHHVISDPRYTAWMRSFGNDTQHVLLNSQVCVQEAVFVGQLRNLTRLHNVHPISFPLPVHSLQVPIWNIPEGPKNILAGRCLQRLCVLPVNKSGQIENVVLDASDPFVPDAAAQQQINDFRAKALAGTAADEAAALVQGVHPQQTLKNLRVSFLGTGSAIPSKYRNVSGILLEIENRAIVLDSGEGSFGQMVRLCGHSNISEMMKRLSCIWISHIHADHHLGLIKIAFERHRVCPSEPLSVFGPPQLIDWLNEFMWCMGRSLNELMVFHNLADASTLQTQRSVFEGYGLTEVNHVPVDHCKYAYGVVMTHIQGWRLVYSGDTRPCRRLIQAGSKADVLIHEATFDDELVAEARARKHSTYSEAVDVGERMDARFIVLTHFSQRYPKLPPLGGRDPSRVLTAFDLMRIDAADLPNLRGMHDVVRLAFPDEDAEPESAQEK